MSRVNMKRWRPAEPLMRARFGESRKKYNSPEQATPIERREEQRRRVLAWLTKNPWMMAREVAEGTGLTRPSASGVCGKLWLDGLLDRLEAGRAMVYAIKGEPWPTPT